MRATIKAVTLVLALCAVGCGGGGGGTSDGGGGGGGGSTGGMPQPPGEAELESAYGTGAVVGSKGKLRVLLRTATARDVAVSLTAADSAVASVPATVTIPAGARSAEADFDGLAAGVTAITAQAGASRTYGTLTVVSALAMTSLSVPSRVQTGAHFVGYAYFNTSAPAELSVTVSSSAPDILSVASAAPVVPFSSSAMFTLRALKAGAAVVTFTYEGRSLSTTVFVSDTVALSSFYVTPTSRVASGVATGLYVGLSAVPAASTEVTFTSSNPAVAPGPPAVTLPAGTSGLTVPVSAVGAGSTVFTARLGSSLRTAALTVVADNQVSGLSCSTTRPAVGQAVDCAVSLLAAGAADTSVTLTSSDGAVLEAPASVVVPTGADNAYFTATAKAAGPAVLTARLGSSSRTVDVKVGSAAVGANLAGFYLSGSSTPGSTVQLVIYFDQAVATDTVVTLTSSNPAVLAPPASVTVATGGSSAAVPSAVLASGMTLLTATAGAQKMTVVMATTASPDFSAYSGATSLEVGALSEVNVYASAAPAADVPVTLTVGTPGIVDVASSATLRGTTTNVRLPVRALAAGQTTLRVSVGHEVFGFTYKVTAAAVVQSVGGGSISVTNPGTLSVSLDAVVSKDTTVTLSQSGAGVIALPASVKVPTGSSSVSVGVLGTTAGACTVTAALGASSVNGNVTVAP